MLRGITGEKEVKQCRSLLQNKLDEIANDQIPIRYSSPAGIGEEVFASYSQAYDLWWYFSGKTDQYWNPFGKGRPKPHAAVTGRCQINMNKKGLNRSVAGAFARDENGTLFLMHNGTIGGGRKGVSKIPFLNWYPAPLIDVEFDGEVAQYFVVAAFDAQNFFEQINFFVEQVYFFKTGIANTSPTIVVRDKKGKVLENGESLLRNPYELSGRTVTPGANHAMITNELLRRLRSMGYSAARNRLIDAFVFKGQGEITHLFEVKSSLSTQTIYTAIGQLMVYGLHLDAKSIMVLENSVSEKLVRDLKTMDIGCITYSWKNGKPVFGRIAL